MDSKLLRLPRVLERVGYKKTQVYELIRRREFPAGYKLGRRAVAWNSEDIDRWIHERIAASRDAGATK